MSNGLIAFLAGLGTGYMNQTEREKDRARQEKIDQITFDKAADEKQERQKRQAGDDALQQEAAPVTVQAGAGGLTKPDTADNRDVGQPGDVGVENGGLIPGVTAGGKSYADVASAQAAADAANTPQAQRTRQIARLGTIDPERAAKLEQETVATDANKLKLTEAQTQLALQKTQRDMAVALFQKGWQGAADLMSNSAANNTKYAVDPDGKGNVVFSAVGPDGTKAPIGTYPDTQEGKMAAFTQFSASLSPETAMKHMQWSIEETRKQAKDAAETRLYEAHAGYWKAMGNAATQRAANGTGKADKMDEDDKIRLTNANAEVKDWEKRLGDAMKDNPPGKDGADLPAVTYAKQQLQKAKQAQFQTQVRVGLITPAELTDQILGAAMKAPTQEQRVRDTMASLAELHATVGPDVVGKVVKELYARPEWHDLPQVYGTVASSKPAAPAAPKTPAGKAAAAAPPGTVVLTPAKVAASGVPTEIPPLDIAQRDYDAALAKARSYGLKQQQQDSAGYGQAQIDVERTKAILDEATKRADAEKRRATAVRAAVFGGPQGPAFNVARP